ncbi:hypothetical protein M3Y94_00035200 [Aphelenchoides besseyi]|nr:hypothetical protein M3Y94_00035200 [Aphelenchoides besseyi]
MLEIIISTAVVGNGIICYLIGYFTYKTICKLNELKAEMSERTRRLQNQMNRLLFTQTVSVFATALIPLLIMLFMMLTSIEIHGMGTFINMILSWIPVLNPICTLIFVHRFRVRILTVILPCARRRIVSTYGSTLTHFSKDATPMTIA